MRVTRRALVLVICTVDLLSLVDDFDFVFDFVATFGFLLLDNAREMSGTLTATFFVFSFEDLVLSVDRGTRSDAILT